MVPLRALCERAERRESLFVQLLDLLQRVIAVVPDRDDELGEADRAVALRQIEALAVEPSNIDRAPERLRVAAERAVMIGDRAGDIVAARANRVRSIGVLWGYGSESELTGAGAGSLCASPGELASCLSRIPI